MKSISKLKVTRILISTGTALILAITGCSKKDHVTPSVDMNKSKPLSMQVSAVAKQPNSVSVEVSGLNYYQHINAKYQYSLVKKAPSGDIFDWKEVLNTSRYYSYNKTFHKKQYVIPNNGSNTIRASFIDGERYIFRIAYKVPGGGDIWFYTAPTEPVTVSAKPKVKVVHDAKARQSMTITPDFIAAGSYIGQNREEGIIVLNLTELVNIDLNNIKSASVETRIASTESSFYEVGHPVRVECDHINDSFIMEGLGEGINYDIKIIIDGVERIVKNVKASGTKRNLQIK